MKNLFRILLIVAAGFWLAGCKASRDVYAVTTTDTLIKFQSNNAGTINSEVPITGLDSGETLQQIDFRSNGEALYGVTSNARVVTINTGTGVCTLLSTIPFATGLTNIVFDVNPQGDYLRVIASAPPPSGTTTPTFFNARIDPTTGALISVDSTTLQYVTNDTNFGTIPQLVGIAHTNNRLNATSTTLYGLELETQSLVRITNAGVLTTIGTVNQSFTANAGFDIVRNRGDNDGDAGAGYDGLSQAAGNASFFDQDLTTGGASGSDTIGGNRQIRSIAVVLDPPKSSGFNY